MEKKTFSVRGATAVKTAKNASVKNVLQTAKALYFQTKNDVGVRLTFEGIKGWRLQANTKGRAAFDDLGASQSLAKYMQEPVKASAKAISIAKKKDVLVLTEKGGTSAVLSLGKDFSLSFVAKDGTVVSEVTEFAVKDGQMIMFGSLEDGEAVFGGGERLDVVNKRGTKIDLYSCDGWNNSSTSYVIIPTFFTSRGGGMFINRYEPAVADFGCEDEARWSYRIKEEIMDCYFYASTDPADTLRGYTELSGHAYMPTPWMQGVQICRYWPDFWTFDEDLSYDSIEEAFGAWETLYILKGDGYISIKEATDEERAAADRFYLPKEDGKYALSYVRDDAGKYYKRGPKNSPGGNSTKTIMENFIKADLKPDAASMEGFGWGDAFDVVDPDGKNRARLTNAAKWLHAHGLHAMVYIGVGRVRHENVGFKEEYLVHADVEYTQPDGTVERYENTTAIPWILGTGDNPDVGRNADGKWRTDAYLDITNDEAVDWYFNQIWGEMVNIGIDGVKIDFCEEMPDGDKPFGNSLTHYRWKNPDRIVAGTEHHAYPTFFISAFYKRMLEHKAKKGLNDGFLVFSRGGGIGSQRSPYMWAGDQGRQYEKLDDQLLATVNSGLSGVPFMSFDMAGYQYWGTSYHTIGKEYESALFARATEFTAFLTNVQTHGDVRHAYEMTDEVQQIYRNFMGLHKDLIPYMQKYSRIACDTGMPPVRHPVLKYIGDANVYNLIDEFMLGDALLVCPILSEDTYERDVYLPAGEWTNLLTGEVIAGGKTVKVQANLGQIPVFMDNNSPDVEELKPVFNGLFWNAIKNF